MATYEMSIKIQSAQVNKNEKKIFNANNAEDAVDFARRQAELRQAYFNRVAPKYYWVKLQSLKLRTPGRIGNPKYDPDADRCDDCGRRFRTRACKGHNLKAGK